MNDATLDALRSVLSYCPETGVFTWQIANRNIKKGDKAGSYEGQGYVRIHYRNRGYSAHRLALAFHTGEWPKYEVDHINGIRDDNRLVNLRDVPKSVNQRNRQRALGANPYPNVKRSTSGRWTAAFKVDRKTRYFGTFDTPEEARAAAIAAKERLATAQQIAEPSKGGFVNVSHAAIQKNLAVSVIPSHP